MLKFLIPLIYSVIYWLCYFIFEWEIYNAWPVYIVSFAVYCGIISFKKYLNSYESEPVFKDDSRQSSVIPMMNSTEKFGSDFYDFLSKNYSSENRQNVEPELNDNFKAKSEKSSSINKKVNTMKTSDSVDNRKQLYWKIIIALLVIILYLFALNGRYVISDNSHTIYDKWFKKSIRHFSGSHEWEKWDD